MKALADCRILVVEDEVLIAMDVERMLIQEGCTVIGPVGTVARALSAIPGGKIDAAVLDVNLGREKIFPVAELLAEMQDSIRARIGSFAGIVTGNPSKVHQSLESPTREMS